MNRTRILVLVSLLLPPAASADPLDVYGLLTGKTVLAPSALPTLPDAAVPDPLTDKTNALARIERAFSEKGIEIVQDGPHFVRLVPRAARDFVTNAPLRGAELAPAQEPAGAAKGQERVPQGMIDFTRADLMQVLDIYAMLSQRTILRPATLPAPTITLKTQGGLSKQEALYAFATVLALNGICVVDDGTSFVQVVPVDQRAQVETRAPKPEPGAKRFDPKKVPSVGVLPPLGPPTAKERLEQEYERLQQAFYEFLHVPDPSRGQARRLLGLYANLVGKTAVPSKNLDGTGIWFHVQTPLTKAELLYAIETTFRLNNLAIVPVGDRKIRVGHISEVLKNTGGRLEEAQPGR